MYKLSTWLAAANMVLVLLTPSSFAADGICQGIGYCGAIPLQECNSRYGCWVYPSNTGQQKCERNPSSSGIKPCVNYTNDSACEAQGGCNWYNYPDVETRDATEGRGKCI